jgi:hypothetical protein
MLEKLGAVSVIFAAFLACSPAWAVGTTVQVVRGDVTVRQGDGGFRQINGATEVYTGNQVMVAPGGLAKIVYPDGCVTQVGPGAVASVGKCTPPMTAGLECDPATDPKCLAPPVARTPWWLIAGVAAGIGVGICAAQGCFKEEHHRPKSP